MTLRACTPNTSVPKNHYCKHYNCTLIARAIIRSVRKKLFVDHAPKVKQQSTKWVEPAMAFVSLNGLCIPCDGPVYGPMLL